MTKQDIFDTMTEHLFKQKARSMCQGGAGCAYRGVNGLKCAVGVLIKDEHFTNPEYNSAHVDNERVKVMLDASGVPTSPDCIDLMTRMQELHDDSNNEYETYCRTGNAVPFFKALVKLADKHSLNTDRILQFFTPTPTVDSP